ncbi:MAG TPA: CHAT domain-containing protein, partial [Thermoanaerobaculia bacterium]|nr:CHAT domain-containing protein [Thermoanaerobaculia bacterium]
MEYNPFIVHLGAGPAGIEARVTESPMGSGAVAPFETPFTPGDLARLASLVEAAAREPSPPAGPRHLAPAGTERAPERELEEAGRRLYQALLPGPLADLWNRSLGSLANRPSTGLRLEIRIDPGSGALAELQGLPWELLHPPGRAEDFLCLRRRTTVVRHLELPRPRETPPAPSPLRVLLVAPSPAGVAPLDLDREVGQLEAALAARAEVRLRRLERPTLDALVRAFDEEPVHGLHFMGHGTFDAGTGRGSLVLEDAGGGAVPVSGEALAGQLADFVPPLRLVFLNACRTAEAAAGVPFAGVATALVEAGVPAVVAMQYPVSDTAAIAFSAEVYRLLAAAEPVDLAVAAGRKAVVRHRPAGSPEWATP